MNKKASLFAGLLLLLLILLIFMGTLGKTEFSIGNLVKGENEITTITVTPTTASHGDNIKVIVNPGEDGASRIHRTTNGNVLFYTQSGLHKGHSNEFCRHAVTCFDTETFYFSIPVGWPAGKYYASVYDKGTRAYVKSNLFTVK